MQAFIDAAAAAEVQTELAARVGEWQGKVSVVLQDQDARPPFDLQAYGTSLLDRLSDLSLRQAPDPLSVCFFSLHQGSGSFRLLSCRVFCRGKALQISTSIQQRLFLLLTCAQFLTLRRNTQSGSRSSLGDICSRGWFGLTMQGDLKRLLFDCHLLW